MNRLPLVKYEYTLLFAQTTYLHPFIGNTIRGALGQALYDNSHITYDAIFKTTSAESQPNPFTISAPYPSKRTYAAGETLKFSLTLFGSACDYEYEITESMQHMCKGKLKDARLSDAECIYAREWTDDGADAIPLCEILTIDFLTPTEILASKKPVREISFNTFIDSLFGRISTIIDNYTPAEFILPYSLISKRPLVTAEYDLTPIDIQTNGQQICGVIGAVKYLGDVTRYLPYIDLGTQIHIGKKTTRTCGEYAISIPPLSLSSSSKTAT